MSANSTSRANRSSKEKTPKTQPTQQTQNAKDGTGKVKATAEQLRMAQIMDKQSVDDPDLQQKVMQLMDLTQKTHDEVVIALHDCDNDANRASIMLLEGDTDQGEWQETGKKRKRGAPAVNSQIPEQTNSKPEFTNKQTDKREKSNDREFKEQSHRSESSSRGGRRRDDGPPRFQRGGKSTWRGKENEENERNRAESKGRDNKDRDRDRDNRDNRERSFDRGRGRGRGGRGRGRGRGGGMDRGERADRGGAGGSGGFNRGSGQGGFDSGPHIDTWTNDQAVVEKRKSGWENMVTEDWNDDAWTGSLTETTVFTASTVGPVSRKVETPPSEPFGQNGTIGPNNAIGQSGIIGQSNSLGHGSVGSAIGDRSPLQTGAIGQSNSLGQTSAIGQAGIGGTNALSASLDLGALLQQANKPSTDVVTDMTSSQPASSQTLTSLSQSQFSKQATDALKSIVGIGTSPSISSTSQPAVQMPPSLSSGVTMTIGVSMPSGISTSLQNQSPLSSSVPITPPPQTHGQISSQQPIQQRPKPARSKLPPPSKIPASAVEMPGHMTTSLDVQFGFMTDFGSTNTCSESTMSSTFTNSSTVSTTGSAMTNHLPLTSQTPEPSATTVSLMASITPPKTTIATVEQSTTRTSMFSSSANTTPTKDFTQSNITKPSGISPPEPIPFPSSQAERPKTSPLMSSQRPTTGSLASTDPVTTYSQSSYSSSYPSSRYQSHKSTTLTTSGYTHGTNSLTSHPAGLQQMPTTVPYQQSQNQYQSQYATSSFQGQTGFSAGPSPGSLYQSTNQPSYGPSSSTYRDSQTGASSYTSGQSGASYPSSQSSGSSYQSSHSQSAGYGTGPSTTYPTTQSSPYPQNQTGPSYQTSQSGSYPSSQSYSNSSQSASSAYPSSNQTNSYQSGSSGASGQSAGSYPTTQASSFPTTQASSYPTTQSGSFPTTQASSFSSSETGSYSTGQSGSRYQSGQTTGQSASGYQGGASTGQSGSSSYPSAQSSSTLPQTGTSYPTPQSTSSYQTTVTQSSTYARDSQSSLSHQASANQTYGSHSNYNSSSHQSTLQTSPMSTTKLNESLSKMTVKDTSMDQTQTSYDTSAVSVSSTATLSSTTMTTSSSLASGSVSVSTSLGLTPMTSTATSISTSTTKSSTLTNATGTTGKAPPNLPPGVPPALLGPNGFIMGQHMPPYFGLTAQQPAAMYCNSYEDLQLLQQQRLPLVSGTKQIQLPGYYDGTLPFQPPTSIAGGAGADQIQRQLGSVPYSGADGKMSRVDAQSPVQGSQTSQQQPTQSAHQQTYINPAATLPPGYGYYIAQTGLVPGSFSYTPTMFPQQVPPVTNAAHVNTTATTQFQKPAAYAAASHGYGTTGYEDLMQAPDYSKTAYGGLSQTQNKVSVTTGIKVGGVNTTTTDLSAAAPYAAKTHTHTQSFDKPGFHAGTPPPFNMQVAGGTQAGPMGAPTTPYAPYMPILQHQPQTQMLHHPLQQDSTGSTRSQQSASQPKAAGSTKNYSTGYWNA